MYNMPFSFKFNNKDSWQDFSIKVEGKVLIPFPVKKTETISVPGGEDIVVDKGGYEDIEINLTINILNKNLINDKYREIKRWLSQVDDDHLIFSDDTDYFYKVKNIKTNNFTTEFLELGSTTITFVCSPYTYFVDGLIEINNPCFIFNQGIICNPLYKIQGSGTIELILNGNKITFENIKDEIIVDSEEQLIFQDGNIDNSCKCGEWEDLRLKVGDNELSYTPKTNVTLIPNWRTI